MRRYEYKILSSFSIFPKYINVTLYFWTHSKWCMKEKSEVLRTFWVFPKCINVAQLSPIRCTFICFTKSNLIHPSSCLPRVAFKSSKNPGNSWQKPSQESKLRASASIINVGAIESQSSTWHKAVSLTWHLKRIAAGRVAIWAALPRWNWASKMRFYMVHSGDTTRILKSHAHLSGGGGVMWAVEWEALESLDKTEAEMVLY